MNATAESCNIEPNFSDPNFASDLITMPTPAASGQMFKVVPLGSASETTVAFCKEFGPHFKLYTRAFNPKTDKFYILLHSFAGSVAKWIVEDEVLLVAEFFTAA